MQPDRTFDRSSKTPDPYEELMDRARKLAQEKRARGEVPEKTNEILDALFIEIAPPGARIQDDSLDALLEMLSRYTFDPNAPLESTRPGFGRIIGLVKRLVRPLTSWQIRHLTNQLNAYQAAQLEIIRSLVKAIDKPKSP